MRSAPPAGRCRPQLSSWALALTVFAEMYSRANRLPVFRPLSKILASADIEWSCKAMAGEVEYVHFAIAQNLTYARRCRGHRPCSQFAFEKLRLLRDLREVECGVDVVRADRVHPSATAPQRGLLRKGQDLPTHETVLAKEPGLLVVWAVRRLKMNQFPWEVRFVGQYADARQIIALRPELLAQRQRKQLLEQVGAVLLQGCFMNSFGLVREVGPVGLRWS